MGEGCLPPEDVDALLAGRLDGDRARRAEAHIDVCARCRKLVGELAKDSTYGAATADTRRSDPDLAHSDTVGQNSATSETLVEGARSADTAVERRSRPSGAIPHRIDRYVIERKLGSGGMGVVFLAEDPELKRNVVIKLLRSEMLEASLQDRARLLREAQAMAKVSHPNVVPIYDVGVHDDQVFLAMEYIDGQDLAAWLETKRTPRREVREIIDVFVAAGRGLAAAHRAGLVHRDFKPHNVMIANTGEVKVTDFGLARAEVIEEVAREAVLDRKKPRVRGSGTLDAATLLESPLTHTGAMVGTPAYMAPEQILVEPVDARTDQFSFCVALYEGLYGERPFRGKTVDELFESTLDGKPLFKIARGIPGRVRAAIRRGLSVQPADRFPTMEALLVEIAPRGTSRYAIAGAVAFVALGSAGAVIAMRRDSNVCTGAAAEIDETWNPKRAKALEAAFVGADQKFGAVAYRALATAVDKDRSTWIANHQDACGDTRVRGEQTEANMERRMQCLRRRRAELDATLEVLAAPDRDLLVNAPALVEQLASPDSCANADALAQAIADPEVRARVDEMQKQLAKADALIAAARLDQAGDVLKGLAEHAEKVGYQPLIADVYLELGTLAETRLDWPPAQSWFDKAVEVAEKVGADPPRARAYIHLVGVARAQGKLDDAERFARYAAATIERLGDKELGAWLDRMVAEVQRARGQNEAAVKTYQRAIERMTAIKGPKSREVAVVQQELAMHYNSNGDYEPAYSMFEQARASYIAASGPDSPDAAAVLDQQAQIRYQQGRFDEALKLSEQDVAAMTAYFGEGHPFVIGAYPLHALRLQAVGKNAEAEALMEKAVALAAETYGLKDVNYATTANTLGLLQHNLGKEDEAFASFSKALDSFVHAYGTEEHNDVVITLNALGTVRKKQKRYDEAIDFYKRSRALIPKFQEPTSTLMSDTITRIGSTELLRGNAAEAVKVLDEALAVRVAGKAGPSEMSWTKLELAKALVAAKGDKQRAVTLAKDALADAKAAGDQAEQDDATKWLADNAK